MNRTDMFYADGHNRRILWQCESYQTTGSDAIKAFCADTDYWVDGPRKPRKIDLVAGTFQLVRGDRVYRVELSYGRGWIISIVVD